MSPMDETVSEVVRNLLEFPHGKVCKHHAVLEVIDKLVEDPSDELVGAIVDADDEKALSLLEEEV